MAVSERTLTRAASLAELRAAGRLVVHLNGHVVCLFAEDDRVHAVDNRCPHMGFPLQRGSLADGILTCHWHHARYDICTGGTFDQWADDLRRFPVEVRGDDIFVDLRRPLTRSATSESGCATAWSAISRSSSPRRRSHSGEADPTGADAFRIGLDFGVLRRGGGWFRGLTTLTCFMNLVPLLDPDERSEALYHGLADVAEDSAGGAPRFPLEPLPGPQRRAGTALRLAPSLHRGSRRRGSRARAGLRRPQRKLADGAGRHALRRCHRSSLSRPRAHARLRQQSSRSLDVAGWERAEAVLSSLAPQLAFAERMEEANSWRHPVDIVALLEGAFDELPQALRAGAGGRGTWSGRAELVETVLTAEPGEILEGLLQLFATAPTRCTLRPPSHTPLPHGSRGSRRPTSSGTGTPRCTRSRSRTRSSRGSVARRPPSWCAACSTRR